MKLVHHVRRHSKTVACHLKKHHKKYLAGFFGGFAVVKLVALVIGLSAAQYSISTYAQEVDCETTGQYLTGEYQTGCIEMPEELTGGYLIDCVTLPGYFTGGTVNDSGELVDRIRIEETETGCILTGETIIPAYTTGCYLTGGYLTGGTTTCDSVIDEEISEEEVIEEQIGEEETETPVGEGVEEEIVVSGNGICESGDIVWGAPLSGSSVRDVFSFDWSYSGSDCLVSGLSLQLFDHNDQRIDLATLASGVTNVEFDSTSLYSFQQSGLYHIMGTGLSGQQYYLYTGTYSGEYSRLFTGYIARILDVSSDVLYETSPFTIDNELPSLTGVIMTANDSTTGYLTQSGVVTLSFTASELLSGVVVTLGSGKVPTNSTISEFDYMYTWELNSLYSEGDITATISFEDIAGNTGSLVYTSAIVFDMTDPIVSGFVFTGSDSGLLLDFGSSEPVHVDFNYRKDATIMSGMVSEYLTAHQLIFTGIEVDQVYTFSLEIADYANNSRVVTGDVMKTATGEIIQHITIVPSVSQEVLSGEVATLTNFLRAEVEKYTLCKEAITYTPVELEIRRTTFMLQMPDFQKSQVKTLVNAFTLFVLDKVKHNQTITKADIDEITKKFDNFLIILKLIRDDDNVCKQNLSNYHVGQFKNVLQEFKIELE